MQIVARTRVVANLCGQPDPDGQEQVESNHHLIAAAPKMLAACKAAHSLLRKIVGKNHDPEYSQLGAAIAKAEGGESHGDTRCVSHHNPFDLGI